MRLPILLLAFVYGCSADAPGPAGGGVAAPGPQVPAAQPDSSASEGDVGSASGTGTADGPDSTPTHEDPATPLAPEGCAHGWGVEPEVPAAPEDFCRAQYHGPDGSTIGRIERSASLEGTAETVVSDTFDSAGTLVRRTVRTTDGERIPFESDERFDMPPDATLPYTYGVPATWSTTRTYDAAGRLLTLAQDLAIDGVVDSEERWTYAGETVVEHVWLHDGEPTVTETFRPDGAPLTHLDHGGYGTVWTYGVDGLLVREDKVAKDVVTRTTAWTMAAPGKALEAAVFDVHEGPDGKAVEEPTGGTTWTWADAVLAAQDSWRIVYGHERTTHIELDALGRQLVFVEETEQPGCHRYEQLSTYAGDVLLDQTTTCDGGLFEHRWSVLDAEGRVSRAERIFLGNPTSTTHEVQIYAWDACGAPTLREHTWNGKVTWREELTWDAAGRLVEKVLVNAPGGEEHAVPYEYDEEGRVVAVGEQRWIRDAEGRIVAFETGGAAAPPELGGGALHTITYSYCD